MKKSPKTFKGAQKGLHHLLHDVMHDPTFVEALERDPKAALASKGYPDSDELAKAINDIDFDVFRRHFGPPDKFWC
jgi:hypothetical protein